MKPEHKKYEKITVLASVALIIILGLALYANSLNGKFVYDDESLISGNAFIKRWSVISKAFSEDIGKAAGITYGFYRPIQIITYAVDYHIWGLNPWGYHLTNIFLHILVSLCVYWFAYLLFCDKTISLLTAVFFVVHPIHTTVVSYISTRAESLYLLFLLISFIFYIKSIREGGALSFLIMLSSYLLGLCSKENALILPVLLFLYHYTFNEKIRIKEFLSLSAAAVVYMFIRVTVLKHLMVTADFKSVLLQRIPGFFIAVAEYLRLMFLPFGLHIEYGERLFNFSDPKAIFGLAILTAMIFCILRTRKTKGFIFFSLSWFIITLLPVSNLYPLNAYMSENWLYLPSIGFFLLLAKGLSALYKKAGFKIFIPLFIIGLITFYSYLTIKQNRYWREPMAFYERTLKYSPYSAKTYNNLGNIYTDIGRKGEA
ncbi:MAG: hypothetical protein PHO42_02475, partial [Candidatus Omnitrophica bacterium]|nr:hypothetical protein [Candidatus Omnitrophota bacterium]